MGLELRAGTIKEVLPQKAMCIVFLEQDDEQETMELPLLQRATYRNRHYQLPDVGEQVYLLLDENAEEGVILGSIYSQADPPPLEEADKYLLEWSDGTAWQYDRKSHVLELKFPDDTQLSYDAHKHKLLVQVAEKGDLQVEVQGNATIDCQRTAFVKAQHSVQVRAQEVVMVESLGGITLDSANGIALTAPQIALNTASLTCSDPHSELGLCQAVLHTNLEVQGETFSVQSGTLALAGAASLEGDLQVAGSIQATGTIMDLGGNSNHHEHPRL